MLRIVIIISLLVSLFFLARGSVLTWQSNPIPPEQKADETTELAPPDTGAITFFHSVPALLPDLHKKYIFSVDRMFESVEDIAEEQEQKVEKSPDEIDIDFESVTYVGSVITSQSRKAIVSYTVEQRRRPTTRVARGNKTLPPRNTATQKGLKYARLVIGDNFDDYNVTGIFPDKIIFQRDDEKIEKFLFDPTKQRINPVPQAKPTGTAKKETAPESTSTARRITVGGPDNPPSVPSKETEATTQRTGRRQTTQQRQPETVEQRMPPWGKEMPPPPREEP